RALKEKKSKAFIIDDPLFRVWDKWIADGKRPVLLSVDVATGRHRYLLAGLDKFLPIFGASARSYDISPDGKELVFASQTPKTLGMDFNYDLYTLPLDGPAKLTNITADNPGNDNFPLYAPDGKSIAYTRQTIKYFYADRFRLMLYDRQMGKSRELTADL